MRVFLDAHGLADVVPKNLALYRTAFVHRSYCTMKNDDFESGNNRCPPDCLPLQDVSYERLEFIGDSVLGCVVGNYMYERYPDQHEGFLSRMRTRVVNGKMLGHLSGLVGFQKFAILSKQVEQVSGRDNYKLLEDILEAFIGALYQDQQDVRGDEGFLVAKRWIESVMETHLDFADLIQTKSNFKDMLMRYMQYTLQDTPRFFEVNVQMVQNQKRFTYCVKDRSNMVLGRATGASKKDAENLAAREALVSYGQPLE